MISPADLFLRAEDNLFQFILAEIQLSLTFAEAARDAGSEEKRERNLANALKGYKTALRFMQDSGITRDRFTELQCMLDKLTGVLSSLAPIPND